MTLFDKGNFLHEGRKNYALMKMCPLKDNIPRASVVFVGLWFFSFLFQSIITFWTRTSLPPHPPSLEIHSPCWTGLILRHPRGIRWQLTTWNSSSPSKNPVSRPCAQVRCFDRGEFLCQASTKCLPLWWIQGHISKVQGVPIISVEVQNGALNLRPKRSTS